MEVGALQTALGSERPRPLQLGAAKSNVGHLEGGAGTDPREVFGEWDGDVSGDFLVRFTVEVS